MEIVKFHQIKQSFLISLSLFFYKLYFIKIRIFGFFLTCNFFVSTCSFKSLFFIWTCKFWSFLFDLLFSLLTRFWFYVIFLCTNCTRHVELVHLIYVRLRKLLYKIMIPSYYPISATLVVQLWYMSFLVSFYCDTTFDTFYKTATEFIYPCFDDRYCRGMFSSCVA
jgi:hypothetical protein